MAEPKPGGRKPRIRKTAPTVRERVEAAQDEADRPKRVRARRIARPLKRLAGVRPPRNRFFNGLSKALAPVTRILRLLVPRYFVNSWREVQQVTWTSRRETWRLTLAVFIFATIFGLMVAGVDKVLEFIVKNVIIK